METTAQNIFHTCEHCGGGMTYSTEHRGMTSQCPHCHHEVVLGNNQPAPRVMPVKKKPSRLLRYLIIAGSTFALFVIIFGAWAYKVRSDNFRAISDREELDRKENAATLNELNKAIGPVSATTKNTRATATVTSDKNAVTPEVKEMAEQMMARLDTRQAQLEKKLSDWNTKEIDASQNGNIAVAIEAIKHSRDTQKATTEAEPQMVARAPWKYYGKPLKFRGTVELVKDFPPNSEFVKAIGGEEGCEIVMVCKDGTIVDMFCMAGSGSLKVSETATVVGLATGTMKVPNAVGGTFTHLVIVGNHVEKLSR